MPEREEIVPAFEPKLSHLASPIAWLHARGVPADQIAGAFRTTPGHIRVLKHRAKQSNNIVTVDPRLLEEPWTSATRTLRDFLGVRDQEDDVVLNSAQAQRFEDLNEALESAALLERQGRIKEGIAFLRFFRRSVGYPASTSWIRLLARYHRQMAWFLVKNGWSKSGLEQALRALQLWRIAYHEWEEHADLCQIAEAALLGSLACLLSRDSERALHLSVVARQAFERAETAPTSEYYQRRGIALFQMGALYDEEARKNFNDGLQALEQESEGSTEVLKIMAGARQKNLIGLVDWDEAQEHLRLVRSTFGKRSLEYSMAVHWIAACGLVIDSPGANLRAIELLDDNLPTAQRFGHQATVSILLKLTLDLNLLPRLRSAWVRRALYENAFRRH